MSLDREAYFFTPRYTRGQVCKALGITKDTLRHYESCGIITPQENKTNQYKYYSIADLEILNVVLFLRAIDVSIQDIPRFIQCNDIDTYSGFLSEQIEQVTLKINYWTHIRSLISYFQRTLEDYKQAPNQVKIVENIHFRFRKARFDYKNFDIEKMSPSRVTARRAYHIIQLKIIGEKWLLSNREDTSDMIIGHLCDEEELEDVCVCTLPKALLVTTLDPLERLPEIIMQLQKKYEHVYEFEENVYFIEHTFLNIFNQGELLRNIYLPIRKEQSTYCNS